MDKIALSLMIAMIIIGIGVYVFQSTGGVNDELQQGHDKLKTEVRQWGYTTVP